MAGIPSARVGDLIVVEGHRIGESRRIGEILEVLGSPGHEHYRVEWDDGHEAIFYPGGDAAIQHVERPNDEPVLVHEP
jgi:hypothetical protein